MPAAGPLEAQRCPDGLARLAGRCKAPYAGTQPPPIGQFGCLANINTVPSPRKYTNMDGRAYNLMARDPSSGALLATASGILDPRWGGGAFYRIHQTTAMANGSVTCQEPDATQQIGCLVQASPCSIGYAGREALFAGNLNGSKAFNVRSPLSNASSPAQAIALDDVVIRRLLDPSGTANGTCGNGDGDNFGYRYPLARRLWIDASKGFGNQSFTNILDTVDSNDSDSTPDLNTKERQLLSCMSDRELTDQAIVDNGFITISEKNCSAGVCNDVEKALGYRARSCQPRCGDAFVQTGEQCDDGNLVSGDGCSSTCTKE